MSDMTTPRDTAAGLSSDAIEGRLMAHRTVLAHILAHLQQGGQATQLMEQLDTLSVMQDHQEDPGAVISGPEVIEGNLAEEIRAVVLAASPDRIGLGEAG